jgi:hypothetical protein
MSITWPVWDKRAVSEVSLDDVLMKKRDSRFDDFKRLAATADEVGREIEKASQTSKGEPFYPQGGIGPKGKPFTP